MNGPYIIIKKLKHICQKYIHKIDCIFKDIVNMLSSRNYNTI